MSKDFDLKALISMVDRMSPGLNVINKNLNIVRRQFLAAGKDGVVMGAGLAAALAVPAKAFMDVESATIGLRNTLMNKDGVSAGFEAISQIATDLGNRLPGTTANFLDMASQLNGLGVDANTIAGGALTATAYLAVVGERFHVTYESASQAVGKLGKAFGIAANDLVPFSDALQRSLHMGSDLTELQYSMARVSPTLKGLGVQGLKVANDLIPLNSMLIGTGMSGETAGTGLNKVIEGFAKAGKFHGMPQMIKDLEKMNHLTDKADRFKKLFGEEGARVANIIAAGGFGQYMKNYENQASAIQRINNSLGTMANLSEAAFGTFTNAMAAVGEVYSPELNQLSKYLNDVSSGLMDWAKNNDTTIRAAIALAGGLVGVKLAALGAAGGFAVISAVMKSSPWMVFAQLAISAAAMVYANWGPISDFFKENLGGAIDSVMNAYKSFIDFIGSSRSILTDAFMWADKTMSAMSAPAANGMRPPGYQKNINSPMRGSVGVSVDFSNAPQGMRVAPAQTKGPVTASQNVGYRTIGTAAGAH
ncbi:MAG: phage tail tape measure protein [Proteobacteria bacterium ST_bin11]|nr:MAG: phage tail tape measure protein [Proteobacteria bacterium ST_bin11]